MQITSITETTTKVKNVESQVAEILGRMDDAEANLAVVENNKSKINQLETTVEKLNDDVATLKGIVQVQDTMLKECKDKITDLTARSMANNIVITGIMGDKEEGGDCKPAVLTFLKDKMLMNIEDDEIKVAHRVGKFGGTKPRPIVVRCVYKLKERLFSYTKNLKGKTNSQGDYYNIRQQLPEPLLSEKIDREERLRAIRKANDQLPIEEQHRKVPAYIKGKMLYINKVPQKQIVKPPTVQEILNISPQDKEKMEAITWCNSDPVNDKGSVFKGFAVRIQSAQDVRLVYRKIKLHYPESHHIIMAYAVKTYVGFQDNGKYSAGKILQNILLGSGCKNTAVFVTREYSGTHLGPRRFMHKEKVGREAIAKL